MQQEEHLLKGGWYGSALLWSYLGEEVEHWVIKCQLTYCALYISHSSQRLLFLFDKPRLSH